MIGLKAFSRAAPEENEAAGGGKLVVENFREVQQTHRHLLRTMVK
jgi:hypothetical protein